MSDDKDLKDDSATPSPQDAQADQRDSGEGGDETVTEQNESESTDQDAPEADGSEANVNPPSESEGSAAEDSERSELAEVKDSLLRARADFDNYKRRAESERLKTIQVARTDVILDLLPVIDNFDRAFADVPKEIESNNWYQGVAAIKKLFEKMLQDLGIERTETVGQEFDPELHEAIAHEDSDQAENVITKEFEAGYRLGDDVIRHARVAVSSGHSDSNSDN